MSQIDIAYHNKKMAEYGRPEWLINSSSTSIQEQEPSLKHNIWIIQTRDPDIIRDTKVTIDFNQVIDECNILLTNPSNISDLLTAKIFIAEELQKYLDAKIARKKFLQLVWIMRWRISMGIEQMQDLNGHLFDTFCNTLTGSGSIHSLIPLETRFDNLKEKVLDGQFEWPIRKYKNQTFINIHAICNELGLPNTKLQPLSIWPDLESLILQTAPDGSLKQISNQKTDTSISENVEDPRLSQSAIRFFLDIWFTLRTYSAQGIITHDPLQFDPFEMVSREELTKQMSRKPSPTGKSGRPEGRMGTPSPEQWLQLLNHAAIWVLDYSPAILKICEESAAIRAELLSKMNPSDARAAKMRNKIQSVITEHSPINHQSFPNIAPRWTDTLTAKKRDILLSEDTDRMSLEVALGLLVTACLILIGGFSARRKMELESLQKGCVFQDPINPGSWLMTSYIAKTIKDYSTIPVPASINYAVKILEQLSATAREHEQHSWITKIISPRLRPTDYETATKHRKYISTKFNEKLKNFAEMTGVDTDDNGIKWIFTPHQLRRAFAVYYYYGQKFGKLDALSRFLRHFDPEMTRRYITMTNPGMLSHLTQISNSDSKESQDLKNEAKKAFQSVKGIGKCHEDVRIDYQVSRMLDMYNGTEHPIGQGAVDLYELLDEMTEQARHHVLIDNSSNISPDDERDSLIKQLRKIAPKRYLEPIDGGHAHCLFNPHDPSHIAQAQCLKEKSMHLGEEIKAGLPDQAYASIEICSQCPHCAMFSENIQVVEERIDQAIKTANHPASKDIEVAARQKLESFKNTLKQNRKIVERSRRKIQ
nr:hypothetical protein [uncultured Cohaesibacter sp.]